MPAAAESPDEPVVFVRYAETALFPSNGGLSQPIPGPRQSKAPLWHIQRAIIALQPALDRGRRTPYSNLDLTCG
jgi:hypothetical protein